MPTNLDSMFDRVSSPLDKVQIVQFQKMNKSKNEFTQKIQGWTVHCGHLSVFKSSGRSNGAADKIFCSKLLLNLFS